MRVFENGRRAGGGAVDAAVATNAALAVVAAHSCGLGGDAFWLIWDGDRLTGLNGSGRSAAAATLEAARSAVGARMPVHGPWTVTVPGAIRSWGDAHERYGRLPWPDLLAPAIELAEGFPASPEWCAAVERGAARYGTGGDWARVFRPGGRPWRSGEVVVPTGLAATLRRIAQEGPDTAYDGPLARRAAAYLAGAGSPLTADDLAAHRSDWTEPIRTTYRGVTATSHAPNSSGAVALQLLNVLERFDPPPAAAFDGRGVADARWVHIGLEAARLTLRERDRLLTDPDAMAPGALEEMLSARRADELAALIDPDRAAPLPPLASPHGGGTVYLAAADRWGGVVSLIESNYGGFGSGLVDPETGVAYQNRGAFFSLDPAHVNALAPRKRTMHTLAPGMLFAGGRPWVVHGAMGGEVQPQVFAQVVSALVDGGVDVATAVGAPRWAADVVEHHGPPSLTRLESRFPPEVPVGLRARGHDVEMVGPFDSGMGHAHAIELVRDPDAPDDPDRLTFAAATDPRCEGAPTVW
jgi:gamma-glutamyltranspeptidase/glutathione hydrolase